MSQTLSQHIDTAYREKFAGSARLYERGGDLFPSGVTHDSRFLRPFPPYVQRAEGSRKWDVDGNELVDYWSGHGALILGHSHPAVVEAIRRQAGLATHPGACHEQEVQWGECVRRLVPSAQTMRFTSSGTEATLMALRVARIVSGKSKVIKFTGNFHGWHDGLVPSSEPPHDAPMPGVTDGVLDDLVIVPPNDLDAVAEAIDRHDPACVIHEGNGPRWGVVPVRAPFMKKLRQLTRDKGVIFILDEVITGFRVAPGGFQSCCDVEPDLSTFAKVLAGGLPGGCVVGRADLLQTLSFGNPFGKKMKHPGTYNANPLSAAAGIAALNVVADGKPCEAANRYAAGLRAGFNELFRSKGLNWVSYGDYSAVKILPEYDGPAPASDDFIPYDGDHRRLDRAFDAALTHSLRCAVLLGGVDIMGWHGITSAAHTDADLDRTISAFDGAIDLLREDGFIE